jgi:UDP:flavonoid glycosyltransferase YjiC (YdhE family)
MLVRRQYYCCLGKRILLTTTGSLGDLHPIMAIGLGLQARGHRATIATSNYYRRKVEAAGLEFAPMGPHFDPADPEVARLVMTPVRGPMRLMREMLYPAVPAAYKEVMDALRGADLIMTHPITFASQIAAEKTGMPWISTVAAPIAFASECDPPVLAPIAGWRPSPAFARLFNKLGRASTGRWTKPIVKFRKSLGLPRGQDPIFDGQHSPKCVLAMFSRALAEPQPDWPPQVRVIGFPFYDLKEHGQQPDQELGKFLDAGEPPVVFTLGSSAVHVADNFYRDSLDAVKRLGCRAVLLAGTNTIPGPLPKGVAVFAYAPYSQILPRAACVVHQGGVGTCGQTMAAGKPMLVVPFAFDQPDNAARLERLGVARTIQRRKYNGRRAAAELDCLLKEPQYAKRTAEIALRVAEEDAVKAACEAVEERVA